MSKAEDEFIDQYTRSLLVQWANYSVRHQGLLPYVPPTKLAPGTYRDCDINNALGTMDDLEMQEPYISHAVEKGWLSKAEPRKVLAAGYAVATAFLRR